MWKLFTSENWEKIFLNKPGCIMTIWMMKLLNVFYLLGANTHYITGLLRLLSYYIAPLIALNCNITFNLVESDSDSKKQWTIKNNKNHMSWWTRWTGLHYITVWFSWYFDDQYLRNYWTDSIETLPIRKLMPELYHKSVVRNPIRCFVFENYW